MGFCVELGCVCGIGLCVWNWAVCVELGCVWNWAVCGIGLCVELCCVWNWAVCGIGLCVELGCVEFNKTGPRKRRDQRTIAARLHLQFKPHQLITSSLKIEVILNTYFVYTSDERL
jgi:hypothetical protein